MRKLGFVLVAMLAMTMIGAAYAAPSTTGLNENNEVNVNISVVESTSLTVDNDINIKILEHDKWFGALSDITVTTNIPVRVNLKNIQPPENWPEMYYFQVYWEDDGEDFSQQGDFTNGKTGSPLPWGVGKLWARIWSENGECVVEGPLVASVSNPTFADSGSRIVLYAIKAENEMPSSDEELTITLTYELVALN